MTPALAVLFSGVLVLGMLVWLRWLDTRSWSGSLVAYRLQLPAQLSSDDVVRWLGMVAAGTHGPRWALHPELPLGVEVVATSEGITHYVLVPRAEEAWLLSTVRAGMPGARLEEDEDFLNRTFVPSVAGEVTLTSRSRPLATERAEATSAAMLASLQPLHPGEEIRISLAMTSAGTPEPIHQASPKAEDRWWSGYLVDGDTPAEPEAIRAARLKNRDALMQVVIRIGVVAESKPRARARFAQTWGTIHGLNAPGVRLVRRRLLSGWVADRMARRALPLTVYPLLLNVRELAGLVAFPLAGLALPGLAKRSARQLPPTRTTPHVGTVLADSNFPGLVQPIAISRLDRLRHMHLLAPTGASKSTLMANIALQDMAMGDAVVVIDPKSDLIDDLLARIPANRHDDVILLDSAQTSRPVGFNLLGNLHSEAERELAVDHVVHIMASIWKDGWGPRSNDLTRNSLLALANTSAPDGSRFTLVETVDMLTNPGFRRYVTGQKTVPASLRSFWYSFEQMTDSARDNMVSAPLNKLRALTTRSSLRLLLGQSDGIDMGEVFRQRKILLVKLSKGTLGGQTSQLVGALLVSTLWHNILRRSAIPAAQRRPVHIHIDEFQDTLGLLPLDIADMLAQSRGLAASLVLAHQHLGQLPEIVRSAVVGTTRSSVLYQLDHADASVMQQRFSPLTADDLMSLPAYEVAMKLSVAGHTQSPVTGITRPLPEPTVDARELAARSQQRYGVPRADVEAALLKRITPPGSGSDGTFGRKTRGRAA